MAWAASSPASDWTIAASDPVTKTKACSVAKRSGCTPSSSGISGKTAAPSGTSPADSSSASSSSSAIGLASGDGRDDAQLVAVLDLSGQVVEVADVLVVEVQVQEAFELGA